MITWFVRRASLRQKLLIAFTGSALPGLALLFVLLAAERSDLSIAATGAARAAFTRLMELTLAGLVIQSGVIAAGAAMAGWISSPFTATIERLESIALGDLETRVGLTHFDNCIGRSARAMQTFLAAARDRERLKADAVLAQAEMAVQIEELTAAANRQAEGRAALEALAKALDALAAGDLTARLPSNLSGDFSKMHDDFNGAISACNRPWAVWSKRWSGWITACVI